MTTNKEKFLALVSKEKTTTLEKNQARIKNRAMLRESQQIAMKVLKKLDELGWSQKDLASALNVSPQQVNKLVKGQENLTLETQIKLQNILDIPLLASYYESKMTSLQETFFTIEKRVQQIQAVTEQISDNYQLSKSVKMKYTSLSNKYSFLEAV